MLNTRHKKSGIRRDFGFTLIELMLAMVIGLIIMGGVMKLYMTTRDTQRTSEDQLQLISDARFVMETIGFDLRHAGIWGGTNETTLILCGRAGAGSLPCPATDTMPVAANDCEGSDWYVDLARPVIAYNDINPYSATCATEGYQPGTDVLGLHYADTIPIATTQLAAGTVYVRSNIIAGQIFLAPGSSYPDMTWYKWRETNTGTRNFPMKAPLYYVSDYTDVVGDGLPSLHRVDLNSGPIMQDRVLIPGVEDFQLEFGLDTSSPKDLQVNTYVSADSVTAADWTDGNVVAVKIWLLMRAERTDRDGVGGDQTFTLAGKTPVTYTDNIRRFLMTSVIRMRNTSRIDLLEAGG